MSDQIDSLLALAAKQEQDAIDSWERSDTDGYISQLVSRLNAEANREKAALLANGNVHEFDALFTLEGEVVPAKIVNTKYGIRWMLFDQNNQPTGEFLPVKPVRESTLRKRGYTEGRVIRPAMVVMSKGDLGSTRPIIVSVGKPTDPPVSIVYTDRFSNE